MRTLWKRLLALGLTGALLVGSMGAWGANVTSDWAKEDIEKAESAGIIPAGLPTDFTNPITRAQFCLIAVQFYETTTGQEITGRATFSDTGDVAVQKMAYLGVVNGIGDGSFHPEDQLTREQAAAILVRLADALGTPLPAASPSFQDNGTISSWALDAVGRVQAAGIMTGNENRAFDPQGSYTIEQSLLTTLRTKTTLETGSASTPDTGSTTQDTVGGTYNKSIQWSLKDGTLTLSGNGEVAGVAAKKYPWDSYRGQVKKLVVGDGLTVLPYQAVEGLTDLTAVTFPSTLTRFGGRGLTDSKNLTDITYNGSAYQFYYALTGFSDVQYNNAAKFLKGTTRHFTSRPEYCERTFTSLDQVDQVVEDLASLFPKGLVLHVPAAQLDEYKSAVDEVLQLFHSNSDHATAYPMQFWDEEEALIFVTINYANGLEILPYYTWNTGELPEDAVELYQKCQAVLSQIITPGMGDYEKVKAIHDYLVNNTVYLSSGLSGTAKGPLLYGKAVCEGYADAFLLLCGMSGIPCLYVSGDSSMDHAWNKVKVDGTWYNVDVTWDDPTGAQTIRYTYFLISDAALARDHSWDNGYLPVCSTSYADTHSVDLTGGSSNQTNTGSGNSTDTSTNSGSSDKKGTTTNKNDVTNPRVDYLGTYVDMYGFTWVEVISSIWCLYIGGEAYGTIVESSEAQAAGCNTVDDYLRAHRPPYTYQNEHDPSEQTAEDVAPRTY
jgi:transglutaminase-like putative cysteine protease